MELFPYAIQYFSCQNYTKAEKRRLEELNNNIFNKLHVQAGRVAGDTGIEGLKLDFRNGLRLQIPMGDYHVRLSDVETGKIFFDDDVSEVILASEEKYYIPWLIEVFFAGEKVFEHRFNTEGQHVHIAIMSTALGDVIAFLPGIAMFAKVHNGPLSIYIPEALKDFVQNVCCEFTWCENIPDDTYAVYYLSPGLGDLHITPINGQILPLREVVQYTLGLDELPPKITWSPRYSRRIREPYVCIGVQASGVAKSWLWPGGWEEIVAYIRGKGYRVICIDKNKEQSGYGFTVNIPNGAEDFTGNKPLSERADMLAYADFFIGLGSGLSWLAWMAGCPVIMIAGFSAPWYEFSEAYRVMNPRVCHGCFNDERVVRFQENICPRQDKEGGHFLECQRMISPSMVKRAIQRCIRDHADNRFIHVASD